MRRGWIVPVVLTTTGVYLALAFAGADTSGGKALGPRLLLPLMPLLTVAAVATIGRVPGRRGSRPLDGRVGGLRPGRDVRGRCTCSGRFPPMSRATATTRKPSWRSRAVPDRIVVADDPFTAQLLFPLYYRKIVFLADSPELAQELGATLGQQRVAGFVLVVSRSSTPSSDCSARPP